MSVDNAVAFVTWQPFLPGLAHEGMTAARYVSADPTYQWSCAASSASWWPSGSSAYRGCMYRKSEPPCSPPCYVRGSPCSL